MFCKTNQIKKQAISNKVGNKTQHITAQKQKSLRKKGDQKLKRGSVLYGDGI